MSNNISETNIEENANTILHKCELCDNLCKKKHCRKCYLKSLEDKQGECFDCKKFFYAIRNDGSKRKRCLDCQAKYNEKHISKCPLCDNDYHAYLDDGRFFDKCYNCYQNTLKKCEKCDKKISINQPLCKECYNTEKNNKLSLLSYSPTSSTSAELTFKQFTKICKNEGCDNCTLFTYCKLCYDKYKITNTFSQCTKCGWKFKGSNTLCNKCT